MSTDLRVRVATATDDAAVAEVITDAYQGTGVALLERAEDVAARRHQGLVIVVERCGQLVATCTLAPHQAAPGAMVLSRFAVHPAAQRQGIGDDVLKELVALLVARGVTTVAGFSLHQMQAAHRLYQRLGAHPTPYAHGTHYELELTK